MASGKRENPTQSEEVDAVALQYENQQLIQQLDAQKRTMHELEKKYKELQEKRSSYDQTLITLNKIWNQLTDDLILLGIRVGGDSKNLHLLSHEDFTEDNLASCPAEETFLHRLLRTSTIQNDGEEISIKHVKDALALRHSRTMGLMKNLEELIAAQQVQTERLAVVLHGTLSSEEAIIQLKKVDTLLREEVYNLHAAIDILHQKHKIYAEEINSYHDSKSKEQSEIKRLSRELEESMAELEESRRKLVILQLQKSGASAMIYSGFSAINGSTPVKLADRSINLSQLKESIEEAKILASNRDFELQEAREDNLTLSKQLEDIENQLKEDKYVLYSKPYTLLKDQLQHLNVELERYKGLIEPLQADRSQLLKKDMELSAKVDSLDILKTSISSYEAKIEELELQIRKHIAERNKLEINLEETLQDSERHDIKTEIQVKL